MEDYTFDLHPTDLGVLLNQNNMCISKSQRADWEAGGGGVLLFARFWYFSGKILSNAH